jgi:hypothetical protein
MKSNLTRRKFVKFAPFTGLLVGLLNPSNAHAEIGTALVQCTYCGTGFQVQFSYSASGGGYNGYQCPKCSKSSRVHWDHKGNVIKVEKI